MLTLTLLMASLCGEFGDDKPMQPNTEVFMEVIVPTKNGDRLASYMLVWDTSTTNAKTIEKYVKSGLTNAVKKMERGSHATILGHADIMNDEGLPLRVYRVRVRVNKNKTKIVWVSGNGVWRIGEKRINFEKIPIAIPEDFL